GGFSGTGPAQPAHLYGSGSLGGTGAYDQFAVDVTDASKPLAITLIMPNWSSSTNPDFDLYLYNSSGTLVARSEGTKRQETIRYQPSVTGTYTIRVSSYTGRGSYFFDGQRWRRQPAADGQPVNRKPVKKAGWCRTPRIAFSIRLRPSTKKPPICMGG